MKANGNNSISEQPVIGITMGDPAGIGPEIIVKTLADPNIRRAAKYIIFLFRLTSTREKRNWYGM